MLFNANIHWAGFIYWFIAVVSILSLRYGVYLHYGAIAWVFLINKRVTKGLTHVCWHTYTHATHSYWSKASLEIDQRLLITITSHTRSVCDTCFCLCFSYEINVWLLRHLQKKDTKNVAKMRQTKKKYIRSLSNTTFKFVCFYRYLLR